MAADHATTRMKKARTKSSSSLRQRYPAVRFLVLASLIAVPTAMVIHNLHLSRAVYLNNNNNNHYEYEHDESHVVNNIPATTTSVVAVRTSNQKNSSSNNKHHDQTLSAVPVAFSATYTTTLPHQSAYHDKNDTAVVDNNNHNNHTVVVVPLRDEAAKKLAQRCVRAGHGAVYIKHHRKAGGTSLYRTLVQGGACRKGIPLFGNELPFFNVEAFQVLSPSTVFVTHLRHPVDRIISDYWYEGRWPRNCSDPCEAKKLKNDDNKVADFDEWVDHVYYQTNWRKLKYRRHNACGQWQSVENYYIRQMLGVDRATTRRERRRTKDRRGFLNKTLTRQDLHRAKEILASFDLVLITEQMSHNPDMIRMYRTIGGVGGSRRNNGKSIHGRKGDERERYYEPPSNETIARLTKWNALDIELYEYAVELSKQTVERWLLDEASERTRKSSDFDANALCQKPPWTLTNATAGIVLGGAGCSTRESYYFHRKCMQHSNEGPA